MRYHANEHAEIEPAEARSIAKEVFLWGMHPVAIYHFRYNFAQNEKNPRYVGINRLSWDRKPQKALPRIETTPNATVLYGFAMLDLSKEPVVITVPEIKDHYWSIQRRRQLCALVALDRQSVQCARPRAAIADRPELERQAAAGFVGADIVQSPFRLRRGGCARRPHR